MEVVTATPSSNGVPPFHNHDVHEWSRIDSLTGVLERARLETDHWTANTSNSSHNYGKVVDTRARSNADGAIQQQARRQLEVFQSSVPGGRLQVIKSHTVSSSRWTSKSPTAIEHKEVSQHFTDLELPLHQLDLSSQKSKATVGRSVGRRPPSRPRGRDESSTNNRQTFTSTDVRSTATANLHRISRLCNQVHDNAVKQTFGKYYHKPPIHERESGDGVEINEIECSSAKLLNGHANLVRTKSTSSEDIHLIAPEKDKQNKSIEDLEDLEQLQNWRRSSKIRRSLQFPTTQNKTTKPSDLPVNNGSVRKIREDLETGRRLNTALRGNNVDLDALDQILQSITTPELITNNKYEQPEKEEQISVKKQKRHSFVTVESLQEVRGRLRRTSSPTDDIYKNTQLKKDEDVDDGIDTEEVHTKQTEEMPAIDSLVSPSSRVRSYVYGMEALMNKKPILGTGSLESRTSRQLNGTSGNRSEDWYNRRKSYGFEQVHNHHDSINTITKNKSVMDSSTDSGICRSSEIVLVPTMNKNNAHLTNGEIESEKDDKYVINRSTKYNNHSDVSMSSVGNVKRYASIFENKKENILKPTEAHFIKGKSPIKDYEGTKITIPIISQLPQESYLTKQFDYRNDFPHNNKNEAEIKRHSIAVDESKYVTRSSNNNFRRTSLAINEKSQDSLLNDCLDDDLSQGKRHKKVEFCKTEVHFAVDSGRVNIVTTDEKPPPTNNFRRRRRNSGTLYNNLLSEANKNGLPVLHFGDTSYEKSLFNAIDYEEDDPLLDSFMNSKQNDAFAENTVTVSTNQSCHNYPNNLEEEKENVECETPKGILKNKPVKPKPYLLGDDPYCTQSANADEKEIWGVRLKPVQPDLPMWKSTVTLKNTLYDKHKDEVPAWDKPNAENPDSLSFIASNSYKTASPTKEELSFVEPQRHLEQFDNIRIISSQPTTKRSSWTIADRVKQAEDVQKPEVKGYSTKVNIGGGSATVIEDLRGTSNAPQTNSELKNEPVARSPKESPKLSEQHRKIKLLGNRTPTSPVVLRKTYCDSKKQELKTAYNSEKLSSPSLVGQNVIKTELDKKSTSSWKKENATKPWENYETTSTSIQRNRSPSPVKRLPPSYNPSRRLENKYDSPSRDAQSAHKQTDSYDSEDHKISTKSVLRNPRRSEMAYFGVKMSPSPKPTRRTLETKSEKLYSCNTNSLRIKKETKQTKEESPIYENVDSPKSNKNKVIKREFDSSILDELTKAADQILQAVNGYAEEAEKHSIEEEKKKAFKKEKLDTISETKSWKQRSVTTKHSCSEIQTKVTNNRTKLKHTSSTSSVESVSESKKPITSSRQSLDSDRQKKKSGSDTSSSRAAATKARRLQRASSREALLQSHGSSSEDLPITLEVPLRKPRLVRKAKTDSGTSEENKSRRSQEKGKSEERIPVGALPTIRHKTAVSTIRSTAEKAQIRERNNRLRHEDAKRRSASRNETTKITSTAKSDKNRNISSKEPINHRISTANIKKCNKADVLIRS